MRVVPKDKSSQLAYFQTHATVWLERAAEIGLTTEEVEQLAARVEAAKAAQSEQAQAQAAARAATSKCEGAMRAMAEQGAALIAKVRAKAGRSDPAVLSLAHLPQQSAGSPVGAPGTPHTFTTELRNNGALLLRWQCDHPHGAEGTMYKVSRSLDGGGMAFVGVVGKKSFVDLTLPPGTAQVTYVVQAVRSTRTGDEAQHLVYLGVPKGHPATMQVNRAA
ncbi:MAG TPA: hypothetical protein VGN72_08515 [Tepidisphaeraceae bacterium]|jgi:hypothetical protein|nr:hypothetical protein [Tepidisphaeraceae bacterium]